MFGLWKWNWDFFGGTVWGAVWMYIFVRREVNQLRKKLYGYEKSNCTVQNPPN